MNPLILYLFGLTTTNPPEVVDTVLARWEDAGLQVQVVSVHCETDNAAYYPADHIIVMCDDLYDRPELARWVLGHELGHAFMFQHHVPQREDAHDQERSADELAFLTSTVDENYAAAKWLLYFAKQHPMHNPLDEHPDPLDRAGELLCLLDGYEGGNRICRVFLETVQDNWSRNVEWVNRWHGGLHPE